MMQILAINKQKDLKRVMHQIKVDKYGIKIMVPKAVSHLIRLDSISNITANILKQEMLSLGGDAAVSRDALTGASPKTDCLLMGNITQFNRLKEKLNKQPFGLSRLASQLSETLFNYQRNNFVIDLGRYKLKTGKKTLIMGIINVTPDSFSQDGLHPRFSMDYIIRKIENMVEEGADIIDIGGESSRPGAEPVSIQDELLRTIPLIKLLVKRIKVPISIDTYKPEVARQALDNGALIVNDITALNNTRMIRLVAKYKAGAVIMHMKGKPRTMQLKPVYKKDVVSEIIEFLDKVVREAVFSGINKNKIIIDPGIGFGKTCEHNLEILKRLNEFKVLGQPILVGVSRKSFIGKILNAPPQERIFGTISSCVLARENGAHIMRVHDVKEVRQALDVLDSINSI